MVSDIIEELLDLDMEPKPEGIVVVDEHLQDEDMTTH